jgi:hypothetical protein
MRRNPRSLLTMLFAQYLLRRVASRRVARSPDAVPTDPTGAPRRPGRWLSGKTGLLLLLVVAFLVWRCVA